MLQELQSRQNTGEPRRRWFADDYFDLYVWHQPDGSLFGIQLCYGKGSDERALTWMRAGGFRHERIDSGEASPFENRSPVMTGPCKFNPEPVRTEFTERATQLEPAIRDLVLSKIDLYPAGESASGSGP